MTREQKNRAICKDIAEKTAQFNALKKELDDLKGYLRVETGEETTDFGTWVVTFTSRSTPTIDAKRLQMERPDIFEEYGRISESKVLKVKAKK